MLTTDNLPVLPAPDAPRLVKGGIAVDDRGEVLYCNDFEFYGVKRFYVVRNHRAGFTRAWHGHRQEHKWAMCWQGAAIIGAVNVQDMDNPLPSFRYKGNRHRFILSAAQPAMLHIPPGHANGFKTLTADTVLVFYSSATLKGGTEDDYRFDPIGLWDECWEVEER